MPEEIPQEVPVDIKEIIIPTPRKGIAKKPVQKRYNPFAFRIKRSPNLFDNDEEIDSGDEDPSSKLSKLREIIMRRQRYRAFDMLSQPERNSELSRDSILIRSPSHDAPHATYQIDSDQEEEDDEDDQLSFDEFDEDAYDDFVIQHQHFLDIDEDDEDDEDLGDEDDF